MRSLCSRNLIVLLLAPCLAFAAGPALAQAARTLPSAAARQDAMGEALKPAGVGGCIYFATTTATRREILTALISRPGVPPTLPTLVERAGSQCSGRPYARSDLALVGAAYAAFRKVSTAMSTAYEFAIGQQRLEAAWRDASPDEKAPYYAVAADFLDATAQIKAPATPIDVAPFARRLGLEVGADDHAAALLRGYFVAAALSERAEAQLAAEGARPRG